MLWRSEGFRHNEETASSSQELPFPRERQYLLSHFCDEDGDEITHDFLNTGL